MSRSTLTRKAALRLRARSKLVRLLVKLEDTKSAYFSYPLFINSKRIAEERFRGRDQEQEDERSTETKTQEQKESDNKEKQEQERKARAIKVKATQRGTGKQILKKGKAQARS